MKGQGMSVRGGVRHKINAVIATKRANLVARHKALETVLQLPRVRAPFDKTAVVLGRNDRLQPVLLPERPRLEHMHIIGATGSGKTNFLEHLVRQDIINGRGVCVVDPHGNHPGSLYRSLLTWLHSKNFTKTRVVHLIDPNAATHTIGFNPLDRGGADTTFSVIAEATFEAFERMWGDEDGNSKPTIQRVLTATFTALGEQRLTLAEARLIFDPDDTHGIRALVLSKLQDSYAYDEIGWLHRIGEERAGRRDFRAEVVGPINRIAKLVRNEAVRAIVGQTERVLDLRDAMDEGHIILANFSGGSLVYEQGADLLGRLLTRFLFFHARRRRHPERPFFVYLDEAHRYLSGDLPNILAEIRKYGVGLTAAHQWLAQLGKPDDPIREAVCKGPNLKLVFRIKDPREAVELAETVIPLDLETPVKALTKPTVVGHRRTLFGNASIGQNSSVTETVGASRTASTAHTTGRSSSETETDSVAVTETESSSHTTGQSTSHTAGSSVTDSSSNTDSAGRGRGQSRTLSGERPSAMATAWSNSTSRSADRSRGRTTGRAETSSEATTVGSSESYTHGHSTAVTVGKSNSRTQGESSSVTTGESVGQMNSTGLTKGTSISMGFSEGIEPQYANLPSAVHGKDNVLYFAAQELLSLPTGEARLAYVGAAGRVAVRLKVPKVAECSVSPAQFEHLRRLVLSASRCAIPAKEAMAQLERREQLLIQQAAKARQLPPEPEEPKSFRVVASNTKMRR
jgi:Type IV secretion-system coupling protein DNA-binding domain